LESNYTTPCVLSTTIKTTYSPYSEKKRPGRSLYGYPERKPPFIKPTTIVSHDEKAISIESLPSSSDVTEVSSSKNSHKRISLMKLPWKYWFNTSKRPITLPSVDTWYDLPRSTSMFDMHLPSQRRLRSQSLDQITTLPFQTYPVLSCPQCIVYQQEIQHLRRRLAFLEGHQFSFYVQHSKGLL
jgi:hypothetical protein